MKKIIAISSSILFLSACNVNTNPEQNGELKLDSVKIGRESDQNSEQFTGLYRAHQSNFLDCRTGQLFVVKNMPAEADTMYSNILPDAYTDEAVVMEMKATRDPNDAGALTYTSGIKMERKNYKNTCIISDYWCIGTEPFWQIQISKAESLIDFHDPMTQKTTHFPYNGAEEINGASTYVSTDGENKIRIVVKKEKCNGAIDKPYDYSVYVEFNGKKYNGCAIMPDLILNR